MIALALFAYAAALLFVVAPAMVRFRGFDRAPNLGILAWQVLVASALLSVVLGALSLLVPSMPVSSGIADFLEACAMLIRQRYSTPGGALLGGLGLSLVLVITVRMGYQLIKAARETRGHRHAHQRTLALVGRSGPDGMTLLEHAAPAAYCLPGRHGRVVLTTGALNALSADQLRAVLAHERAHLRNRHHWIVGIFGAIATAFPPIRAFGHAHAEIARLIELAADDAAVARTGRFILAEALLSLNSTAKPAAALAAGGSTSAARVRRLIDAHQPLRLVSTLVGAGLALAVFIIPLAVASSPALAAIPTEYCPLGPGAVQDQAVALLSGISQAC